MPDLSDLPPGVLGPLAHLGLLGRPIPLKLRWNESLETMSGLEPDPREAFNLGDGRAPPPADAGRSFRSMFDNMLRLSTEASAPLGAPGKRGLLIIHSMALSTSHPLLDSASSSSAGEISDPAKTEYRTSKGVIT